MCRETGAAEIGLRHEICFPRPIPTRLGADKPVIGQKRAWRQAPLRSSWHVQKKSWGSFLTAVDTEPTRTSTEQQLTPCRMSLAKSFNSVRSAVVSS